MTVAEMGDRDIYLKGAWILHTLRYLIGEDALGRSLRGMAYPTRALEGVKDGGQFRFASTEDFVRIAEEISGRDLSWFFEVYVRQPTLPELRVAREGSALALAWITPNGLPFPMPLEVSIGNDLMTVDMTEGIAVLQVPQDVTVITDPERRILKSEQAGTLGSDLRPSR
jgi:aminopeptidase N